MEVPALDAEELAAIRDAIASAPSHEADDTDAVPLSLIADDRAALSVRPAAGSIVDRWSRLLNKRLRRLLGPNSEVKVVGADAVDGQSLRARVDGAWTAAVDPTGRSGDGLVCISGALIDVVAARLLGDDGEPGEPRETTITALRLFDPVGSAIVSGLADAWRSEQNTDVYVIEDAERSERVRAELLDAELVIALRLSISGELEGRISCLARPETLVPPVTPLDAVPAPHNAIDEALGQVSIPVRVDLGSIAITARQLADLQVGSVLSLGAFIDDPLAVECAGVTKAWGTVVVHRGVLSIAVNRTQVRKAA